MQELRGPCYIYPLIVSLWKGGSKTYIQLFSSRNQLHRDVGKRQNKGLPVRSQYLVHYHSNITSLQRNVMSATVLQSFLNWHQKPSKFKTQKNAHISMRRWQKQQIFWLTQLNRRCAYGVLAIDVWVCVVAFCREGRVQLLYQYTKVESEQLSQQNQ
ncbi:Hypothetical_protein [Hexamita inflata]|uniref:Hypothetical_protein n=1 Tax=Hexamita inflata TaxID=28002 RepID=A0AA86P815_9EUKA|nr:Hypothetical protein HINF_LOCUS21216 [Hexamita inflata]